VSGYEPKDAVECFPIELDYGPESSDPKFKRVLEIGTQGRNIPNSRALPSHNSLDGFAVADSDLCIRDFPSRDDANIGRDAPSD
jgi:hypothetical protein